MFEVKFEKKANKNKHMHEFKYTCIKSNAQYSMNVITEKDCLNRI